MIFSFTIGFTCKLMENLYENRILTIDNVLPKDICSKLIKLCEEKGWNKSSVSGGGHGRTGREDPRTNSFCVIFDNDLASLLWKNIKNYLEPNLAFLGENVYFNSNSKGAEWEPSFIFNKMRIYKYNPGEAFPEHIDYKVKRNVRINNNEFVQQSFMSLLVYLNDDFENGQTGYWPDHNGIHCRFLRDVEKQHSKKDHQILIIPKQGRCVIQDQNILHEGLPTTKCVKYLLRTDIIHERKIERNPKLVNKDDQEKDFIGEWERLFETSCKNYAD